MAKEPMGQRKRCSSAFISEYLTQKLFILNFQTALKIICLVPSSKKLDPMYQNIFGKKNTTDILKAENNNLMPHS